MEVVARAMAPCYPPFVRTINGRRAAFRPGDKRMTDPIRAPQAPIVEFRNVSKVFFKEDTRVHALHRVTAQVRKGELLAIVGPSGCGKSTL
ncbi:MAG TPA: ATP-binding cassette domain-containing protein, partial [Roseateles sp.]|nr:ATP-binding cassette domain-containing protein [Roseateles sp.]